MAKTTKKATSAKKTTRRSSTTAKESTKSKKTGTRTSGTAKRKVAAKRTTRGKRAKTAGEREVTVDRRREDRRSKSDEAVAERQQLERREKVNRRRQIDPTTCERDYSDDEVEFMNALDDYKRTSGRMFPTCSEVLEVLRGLGYAKSTPPQDSHHATPEQSADPIPPLLTTSNPELLENSPSSAPGTT